MNINRISFKADSSHKMQADEYKDPLLKWPLRGAAFTNEVGEGLRPLIGSAATLFWAPVFLYIGADVYDKYKNDKDVYSPDSRRMLKQACFQGFASVILPLAVIKAGQATFSLFGLSSKEKLTYNVQDKINELAKTFVANGNMKAYENKENECVNKFRDIVKNNLDFKKNKNFITKNLSKIQEKLKINTNDNIQNYTDKTIQELIETRKSLFNPTNEFKQKKVFSIYEAALKKGETKSVASKSALTKMISNNTLKGRIIKTIGGFIAVGCAINPMDKFVEHTLIEKYLGPQIDKLKKDKK